MKRILQRAAAAAIGLILASLVLSPAVYGLRVYDATARDYPAFSAAARSRRRSQTEDTLIVKTDGTLPDFRALHPQKTVQGPDDTYTVTFSDAQEAADKLSDVLALRGVEYAEPNARVVAQSAEQPAVVYATYGMELMRAAQFAADLREQSDLQPVVVAVVDSGIKADLPIFAGRLVEGATMIGIPQTIDRYGHGTSVAGVIADCTQGLPVQIMPVCVLDFDGTGSLLEAANGIRYAAEHGASILNLSFVADECSRTLHDAVDDAIENDCLPVICAGNYATDMDHGECCPADYAAGFVVSGCDRKAEFYAGSCYGSTVDLCAPAVDVPCIDTSGATVEKRGTSFAAPHVSALAALYKLYQPEAGRAALERMLILNTRDVGAPGYDVRYGWGLPDLSAISGTGTVDPARTVTQVQLVHLPDKTTYYYKESFSPDGFQIRVLYSDGTEEIRSTQGVQFQGADLLTRGRHTIRAVYDGHGVTFEVTVKYRWWQWIIMVFLFGNLWYT